MNRSWRGSRIYEWRGWVVLLVGNYKVSFKWRPGGAIGRWGRWSILPRVGPEDVWQAAGPGVVNQSEE